MRSVMRSVMGSVKLARPSPAPVLFNNKQELSQTETICFIHNM